MPNLMWISPCEKEMVLKSFRSLLLVVEERKMTTEGKSERELKRNGEMGKEGREMIHSDGFK